jgi:endoglucanase
MVKILLGQLASAEQAGLGVMVQPQRQQWKLQDNPHDRDLYLAFWDQLAPLLAPLDKNLTFPELVNEPNFPKDSDWDDLRGNALAIVRKHLSDSTVIVTGNRWSSIDGLTDTRILPDKNVVYSFHFYEPAFLVSEYRGIAAEDAPAVAALPFPITDQASCLAAANLAHSGNTQNQIKYYCTRSGWTVEKVKALIRRAAAWGRANSAAVINTELGILNTRSTATRLAWIRVVRETCDESQPYGMGNLGVRRRLRLRSSPRQSRSTSAGSRNPWRSWTTGTLKHYGKHSGVEGMSFRRPSSSTAVSQSNFYGDTPTS